jgi:hypothetical protein
MKLFKFLLIFLCFKLNLNAQDSINDLSKNLTFSIENNFNYRYVRVPTGRDMGVEKMNYLDTCNVACNMKSFSIKFEQKIWKFIAFQGGLLYGRKGFMGCRDVIADDYGRLILIYTQVPLKTYTLPLGIIIHRNFFKSRLNVGINSGLELNYITFKERNSSDGNRRTIKGMQFGFFGFDAVNKISNQLSFQENAPNMSLQYYVGLNLKIIIFKNSFLNLGYAYISDFKFNEVFDDLYVRNYKYERKTYIHRYGGGIGFMF